MYMFLIVVVARTQPRNDVALVCVLSRMQSSKGTTLCAPTSMLLIMQGKDPEVGNTSRGGRFCSTLNACLPYLYWSRRAIRLTQSCQRATPQS